MTTLNILDKEIELVTKEVTIREVYEALKKNGFTHLRETWFGSTYADEGFTPTQGCVLAQAAFNLGVPAVDDMIIRHVGKKYFFVDDVPVDDDDGYDDFLSMITREQHSVLANYSLAAALDKIYIEDDSKWYTEDSGDTVGNVIIYWNDKYQIIDGRKVYQLATYEEVAEMAYDVLSPHFDRVITLAVASRETGISLVRL